MTVHDVDAYPNAPFLGFEVAENRFINSRQETVNSSLELTTNAPRNEAWLKWANQTMPKHLFEVCGLLNCEGSNDWANLVEHSMFVAAAALAIARKLEEKGVTVDESVVIRAAWVHDATKRSDVLKAVSREDELTDDLLPRLLAEFGYTLAEIAAAKNTGRMADRYIADPQARLRSIEARTVEENIVGYADARSRGIRFESVANACASSIMAKPRDVRFFEQHWAPYYDAVEGYFGTIAPGFDPTSIDEDVAYQTILNEVY